MIFYDKSVTLKDGRKCLLRLQRPEDAEQLLEHAHVVMRETEYGYAPYPDEYNGTVEQLRQVISNTTDTYIGLLGFIDGKLVAEASIAIVAPLRKLSHRSKFSISIQQEAASIGLGSEMLAECITIAKELQYEQIELGVFSTNIEAIGLYKKFGFQTWGVAKNAFQLDSGIYIDDVNMVLFLK